MTASRRATLRCWRRSFASSRIHAPFLPIGPPALSHHLQLPRPAFQRMQAAVARSTVCSVAPRRFLNRQGVAGAQDGALGCWGCRTVQHLELTHREPPLCADLPAAAYLQTGAPSPPRQPRQQHPAGATAGRRASNTGAAAHHLRRRVAAATAAQHTTLTPLTLWIYRLRTGLWSASTWPAASTTGISCQVRAGKTGSGTQRRRPQGARPAAWLPRYPHLYPNPCWPPSVGPCRPSTRLLRCRGQRGSAAGLRAAHGCVCRVRALPGCHPGTTQGQAAA